MLRTKSLGSIFFYPQFKPSLWEKSHGVNAHFWRLLVEAFAAIVPCFFHCPFRRALFHRRFSRLP
jgi:hypothetical protein